MCRLFCFYEQLFCSEIDKNVELLEKNWYDRKKI